MVRLLLLDHPIEPVTEDLCPSVAFTLPQSLFSTELDAVTVLFSALFDEGVGVGVGVVFDVGVGVGADVAVGVGVGVGVGVDVTVPLVGVATKFQVPDWR